MPEPRHTTLSLHSALADIDADQWNALAATAPPFMRHEYLSVLEETACVAPETGWQPCHATLSSGNGDLLCALPLYKKEHSWGEFIFDWAWADAYRRAGLNYYPKLICASPFTPATAPRILTGGETDGANPADAMLESLVETAALQNVSSLHLHFIDEATALRCERFGLSIRKDCQFHWINHDYESFDDFLSEFSSAKRKKVRRERRRIRESGITFAHRCGSDISDDDWHQAWQLTRTTFVMRGHEPYLSLEFFIEAHRRIPAMFHLIFAVADGKRIAAAILFESEDTLYGRYWGANADYHSLHFETCYYQGIDYCIAAGLKRFEPGTQGEHKISRGFVPTGTWSAHWLRHPEFASAIDNYLDRERHSVDRYVEALGDHLPFRTDFRDR